MAWPTDAGKKDAGTHPPRPSPKRQPMVGDAKIGIHHQHVRPSNHSRRIAFFVVVAYGENLKWTRTVVWNQLLARMGRVETQRSAVPRGAAFSLNFPIAVATPKLANTLTVYVTNTRRDAHSHLGLLTAVKSSPWSQGRLMMSIIVRHAL